MRNYLRLFKRDKGFTLIELLVVIGILGVFSRHVSCLQLIRLSRLKKRRTAATQNTAVEFQDAMIRYYTAQTGFPWESSSSNGTDWSGECNRLPYSPVEEPVVRLKAVGLDTLDTGSPATGCVSELITTGELKTGFLTHREYLKRFLFPVGSFTKDNFGLLFTII